MNACLSLAVRAKLIIGNSFSVLNLAILLKAFIKLRSSRN